VSTSCRSSRLAPFGGLFLDAAKAIGLTVSPILMAPADAVIE
jgi:hypothetical protein